MYIDDQRFKQKGKMYRRVLLRNSHRNNGKVCHDTIVNLSNCGDKEIDAIKFALAHRNELNDFNLWSSAIMGERKLFIKSNLKNLVKIDRCVNSWSPL